MNMPAYKYFDSFRPDPRTGFIGYKCPYYICDLIVESHEDMCLATRQRLNAMGGPPNITEKEFESVFLFNFAQWTHRHPGVTKEILESFGGARIPNIGES